MDKKDWSFFYVNITPCEFPFGIGDDVYDVIIKKNHE